MPTLLLLAHRIFRPSDGPATYVLWFTTTDSHPGRNCYPQRTPQFSKDNEISDRRRCRQIVFLSSSNAPVFSETKTTIAEVSYLPKEFWCEENVDGKLFFFFDAHVFSKIIQD